MRILVFGDSIAQGFWDAEVGGWVARLRRDYDTQRLSAGLKKSKPSIFNIAIDGEPSSGIVKRLDAEADARVWPGEHQLFVIATGIVNSVVDNGMPRSSLEEYKSDLRAITDKIKQRDSHVLFVGLTPVDDEKCNPVSWDKNVFCENERIWKFEQTLRAFCSENDVPLVRIYEVFKQANELSSLLVDGVHPGEAGHELIASLVKPELEKLIH